MHSVIVQLVYPTLTVSYIHLVRGKDVFKLYLLCKYYILDLIQKDNIWIINYQHISDLVFEVEVKHKYLAAREYRKSLDKIKQNPNDEELAERLDQLKVINTYYKFMVGKNIYCS